MSPGPAAQRGRNGKSSPSPTRSPRKGSPKASPVKSVGFAAASGEPAPEDKSDPMEVDDRAEGSMAQLPNGGDPSMGSNGSPVDEIMAEAGPDAAAAPAVASESDNPSEPEAAPRSLQGKADQDALEPISSSLATVPTDLVDSMAGLNPNPSSSSPLDAQPNGATQGDGPSAEGAQDAEVAPGEQAPPGAGEGEAEGDAEYEVKTINDRRYLKGVLYYLVEWADGSETWEPLENLESCQFLLQCFEERLGEEEQEREKKKAKPARQTRNSGGSRLRSRNASPEESSDVEIVRRKPRTRRATAKRIVASDEETAIEDQAQASGSDAEIADDATVDEDEESSGSGERRRLPLAEDKESDQDEDYGRPKRARSRASTRSSMGGAGAGSKRKGKKKGRKPKKAKKEETMDPEETAEKVRAQMHEDLHLDRCMKCGYPDGYKPTYDDEFGDDEEDDSESFGPLHSCSNCIATYHERCLPKGVKWKKPTVKDFQVDDKFVCPDCNPKPPCVVCHGVASPSEEPLTSDAREPAKLPEGCATSAVFRCSLCERVAHWECMVAEVIRAFEVLHKEDEAGMSTEEALFELLTEHMCTVCLAHDGEIDKILTFRDVTRSERPIVKCKETTEIAGGTSNGPSGEALAKEDSSASLQRDDSASKNDGDTSTNAAGGNIGEKDHVSQDAAKVSSAEPLQESNEGDPPAVTRTFREFLIKFKDRSYRHVFWLPEGWLQRAHRTKHSAFMRNLKKDNPNDWPKAEDKVVDPHWIRVDKVLAIHDNGTVLIKWQGLPHTESTWEQPCDLDPDTDLDLQRALQSFEMAERIDSASCRISRPGKDNDERPDPGDFEMLKEQPEELQVGQLKEHQIDGLNWLVGNWCARTPCILADEMGLGKTIQIVAFLQYLHLRHDRFPFLVIAPNSTLENWEREFAKWAPQLHVVSSWGLGRDRDMIKDYELLTTARNKRATVRNAGLSLKCHVVVASYESVQSIKELCQVYWDAVVVDEGHRLKNDESKLFVHLQEFHVDHKVLLTGTPLQNNLRELFNLMSFLDPEQFDDPESLAVEYDLEQETEHTKDKVKELHELLRPHFLRRIKSQIDLGLPPKAEILVPVRMTPLQKELIKDIYSSNFQLLKALGKNARKGSAALRNSSLQNILMQCRKVLSHPFVLEDVEPGLPPLEDPFEIHRRMAESGGKLELLAQLLPKLRAGGHKVLIFCQFMSTLDILEDFLVGLHTHADKSKSRTPTPTGSSGSVDDVRKESKLAPGMKFFKHYRLDGGTDRRTRQERIDAFNTDPDAFVFVLSTRAGGVGINLTAADTVVIFDVDWNPHQDVQAIARAHRIGQTRPVLAFKLMTRGSVEERMVAVGRKKLALDHVIVQKMKEEDVNETDLLDVIRYGATAVFEDDKAGNEQTIRYTEEEVDGLLDRSQAKAEEIKKADEDGESGFSSASGGFGFEKVWLKKAGTGKNDATTVSLDEAKLADAADDGDWERVLEMLKNSDQPEEVISGLRKRKRVDYTYGSKEEQNAPKRNRAKKGRTAEDEEFVPEPEPEEARVSEDLIPSHDVPDDLMILQKVSTGVPMPRREPISLLKPRNVGPLPLDEVVSDRTSSPVPPPLKPPTLGGLTAGISMSGNINSAVPVQIQRQGEVQPSSLQGQERQAYYEKQRQAQLEIQRLIKHRAQGQGKGQIPPPQNRGIHRPMSQSAERQMQHVHQQLQQQQQQQQQEQRWRVIQEQTHAAQQQQLLLQQQQQQQQQLIPQQQSHPQPAIKGVPMPIGQGGIPPPQRPPSATGQRREAIPMPMVPQSAGGRTALEHAKQIHCWVCDGSQFCSPRYHLPTRCPALMDLGFVQAKLEAVRRSGSQPRAAIFLLETVLQRRQRMQDQQRQQ